MEKDNTPITIYIDLSKAFDNINHWINYNSMYNSTTV